MFIVLDGPDGSGTSFHSRMLAEELKSEGREVFLTAEPTIGPIGTLIRAFLKNESPSSDTLQLLFTADRAMHQNEIREALDEGKTVICDRYRHSTYAYGLAFGLDLEWLKTLNMNFIRPDVVIFTLPPLPVCLERMGRRAQTDAFEKKGLQEKVYAAYERLAREDPSIHAIDTSGEKGKVVKQIRKFLLPLGEGQDEG